MKFKYFGKNVSLKSDYSLFTRLFEQKFNGFLKFNQYKLDSGDVNIWINHNKEKSRLTNVFSNNLSSGNNKVSFTYRYLTSFVLVDYYQKGSGLDINIGFNYPLAFRIYNMILGGLLERQLVLNVISDYIEKIMLYEISKKGYGCIHASAVEKQGIVIAFCGLNSSGKSSVTSYLIKNRGYHFFSDNYLLHKSMNVFFYPDQIRIPTYAKKLLNLKTSSWGFDKFRWLLDRKDYSKEKSAVVRKIYIVYRGKTWTKRSVNKKQARDIISLMQSFDGENIEVNPMVFINLNNINKLNIKLPSAKYYLLEMGKLEDFPTNNFL